MKLIKRNGMEVEFDKQKIVAAVTKASQTVAESLRLNDEQIEKIADMVTKKAEESSYILNVEDIQNMVEKEIMRQGAYEVAQKYIRYRYKRELARKSNTTDDEILSLLELANEEIKQENSNKNPTINATQRDYMAGEVSKDLSRRILLPKEVVDAHDRGEIHFHDMDYYAQHMYNCCLINLEDMLQNGTVISETMIEKPHTFYTACNITTQVVAQVASNQYGGQTWTLSHIAPFVNDSRIIYRKEVRQEFEEMVRNEECSSMPDEQVINRIAEKRLKKEIERGVQTLQYQLVTLMTTNGQTPFVSVFMYLNEVPEGQLRNDLAMIIEEVLKQRIQGVKNKKGAWITPAFPKLLYVLEADNITPDGKYWYLTELAAKCTAKRMVPDYISEKKMLEYKGEVYPCMGCRSFLTVEEKQK